MKKYKVLGGICGVLVLIFLFAFLWWNRQVTFLKFINMEKIDHIVVFDGETGNGFGIENEEDISYLVENIRQKSFKKDSVSLLRLGIKYKLVFKNSGGKAIGEFTINDDHTIRKDPFFYETDAGSMRDIIDYLDALESEAINE